MAHPLYSRPWVGSSKGLKPVVMQWLESDLQACLPEKFWNVESIKLLWDSSWPKPRPYDRVSHKYLSCPLHRTALVLAFLSLTNLASYTFADEAHKTWNTVKTSWLFQPRSGYPGWMTNWRDIGCKSFALVLETIYNCIRQPTAQFILQP